MFSSRNSSSLSVHTSNLVLEFVYNITFTDSLTTLFEGQKGILCEKIICDSTPLITYSLLFVKNETRDIIHGGDEGR